MYGEYSGWSTRSPSGVSSWTNSAPPMISGTGAISAATAAASTDSGGIATSLSLTVTPSSRTRDHRQLASGHQREAGSPPIDALIAGTHARVCVGAHIPRQHTVPAGGAQRTNRGAAPGHTAPWHSVQNVRATTKS